jgi:hypothetical protein
MAGKTTKTVEVSAVPHKAIAESICMIAGSLKADGHDQDTIRTALMTLTGVARTSADNRVSTIEEPTPF